ncbi:MAG: response regulator [Phenylobacterium sp.]|uniref:response regulator n=1 Tax=unclassified Phenylobacterium TaxID=2640670 RepID=UPI0008C68D6D|nr:MULTISPECIES: response regulator [unclassified Phenylobacterium]MBA4794428.1 response regulator [Phenylobacterium sp.]OHB28630.1 MAG: transcriptional regulator [Phenylobacterium sp. RIFCSPHIGHO2_01_FULL_69_31]
MPVEPAPLVLYVEDDPAVCDLGVTALEEGGYRVTAVDSGAAAIALLETPGADFVALVTDIDLKGDSSGWDVARRARELFCDLPIIYVSGASGHEWPSRGVPGSIMLAKPFALAQMVVAVANVSLGAQSDLGGA